MTDATEAQSHGHQLFSSFVAASSTFIVIKAEEKEISSSFSFSSEAIKEVVMKEEKKEISSSSFLFIKKEGLCDVGNNQDTLVWFEEDKGS